MAKKHGRSGILKVGTNAVGELQEWDFTHSVGTDEVTSMGDTSVHRISNGFQDASGSFTFLYDAADAGQDALSVGSQVTIQMYEDGDATGAHYWQASNVLITEISRPQTKDGFVTHSASWVFGNGSAITEATVAV